MILVGSSPEPTLHNHGSDEQTGSGNVDTAGNFSHTSLLAVPTVGAGTAQPLMGPHIQPGVMHVV